MREETLHLEYHQGKHTSPLLTFHNKVAEVRKNKKEIGFKYIFIEQLELSGSIIAIKGLIYIYY